ncbi:olfactory receptor 52K1-like [Bombina bombina]|uniref:olfactory receptor 52K1-like n=1 Tax=Bombina bombina TaxID=8345 RepID=UPI00235A6699|nr:olfactory receptor 52K1-like [Bombina bombina]
MDNESDTYEFLLVGFPGLPQKYHTLVAVVMFTVYLISLFANGAVIALIVWGKHLHQPMYIIIANLALSDLLFDTITLPKIIARYWFGAGSISFFYCMFQLFCVHFLGSVDSYVIMMMAIDRYVAICLPLRYSALITNKRIFYISGSLGIVVTLSPALTAIGYAQFPYCSSRKVNNCFCVSMAITPLACGDTLWLSKIIFIFALLVLLLPLFFIIFSYVAIIYTVCSSIASGKRWKAIYTCTTHLFIIGMYYGPRLFVYTAFQLKFIFSLDISVLLLFLYTFIPHMANPIIYCLRAKEIRQTAAKIFKLRFKN